MNELYEYKNTKLQVVNESYTFKPGLLLLLLHILKQPITFTITVTGNIWGAYYYYYNYFSKH